MLGYRSACNVATDGLGCVCDFLLVCLRDSVSLANSSWPIKLTLVKLWLISWWGCEPIVATSTDVYSLPLILTHWHAKTISNFTGAERMFDVLTGDVTTSCVFLTGGHGAWWRKREVLVARRRGRGARDWLDLIDECWHCTHWGRQV